MPMNDSQLLGDTKPLAEKSLNQLWQCLAKNSNLQHLYLEFLQEYRDLEHMELVEEPNVNNDCYYLPHTMGYIDPKRAPQS